MQTTSVQDQISSAIVDSINVARLQDEITQLNLQDQCFIDSMKHVDKIREFIGTPENILGSDLTKHGEIAEHVEVGIRNARDALAGDTIRATFEGVGRTAPEDYLIDGIQVQSKFINGLDNNLDHVLKHMNKYENFGRDGSYYHIPKDHYELISKIHRGESIEGLSQKTINSVQAKIEEIQTKSGQSFNEVVRPGVSDYAEVQQGQVHETLNKHSTDLEQKNEKLKDIIHDKHQANLTEGLKAAGTAAAVGGAIALSSSLYLKYKNEGKNLFKGELTKEDWSEVGLNTVKASALAGVTGAAVYGLTNCAGLAAPLAGAFVTASKGVSSLVHDFYQGKLTFEEFQINSIFVCADSAGVGLAALAGQTFIPIPILGAIIGSIAGKFVCEILLGEDKKLAQKMDTSMQLLLAKVDEVYINVVNKINTEFEKIADLRSKAFDLNTNISIVESSIILARAHGVEESKILKNEDDLRSFLFD